MKEQPVISFQDVTFAYESERVLEGVSFQIHEKEFVSIVGPNGGGKTTLFKLMLGLHAPDRGEIRILGKTPVRARQEMGYVPQFMHYDVQFPISVMEVVLMGRLGRRWGGFYTKEDYQAAQEALEEMQLTPLADRLFAELSGGERQRVLIARALSSQPEILLLDEPTANVDFRFEARLLEILESISERMTVLMISHDVGIVSRIFASVICVNRKVVKHPTSELTGEMIQDIYEEDVVMVRHDHKFLNPKESA